MRSPTGSMVAAGLLVLVASPRVSGQETSKTATTPQAASRPTAPVAKTAPPPAAAPAPALAPSTRAEPVERQPYRIVFHFACHPSSRIDPARRAELLREWHVMVRRFVGTPWAVTIAPPSSPVLDIDLEGLEKATRAQAAAFEKAVSAGAYDKVWVVHADQAGPREGLVFTGREYDTATRRLGPFQRRTVGVFANAPRTLLEFTLDLFSPTALISGTEGGKALLTVRGSALVPASPAGSVVSAGSVLQPMRIVSAKDGRIIVRIIPWTYLRVESVDGPVARCAIISGLNDPLSNRYLQPNSLAAVGIKPGNSPLRLRFVTAKDKAPGAGYTLTARLVPSGAVRELGMTDRSGRIVLKPGFADGLVIIRLLAGNIEPVREFPVMPGESAEERTIPFEPRYRCVALEAEVDSLRDGIVDLIALRARLEARMKARLEGEDWEGLEQAVKEYHQLTPRDEYAKKLAALKERATQEQAETKIAILTKTAQAQITEVQSMIDRYLDNETITAYREALEHGKAEPAAKQKALAAAAARKAEEAKLAAARLEAAKAETKAASVSKSQPPPANSPAPATSKTAKSPPPGPVVPF